MISELLQFTTVHVYMYVHTYMYVYVCSVCTVHVCTYTYMSKSTGVYLVLVYTHVPGTQVLFLEKTKTLKL